MIPAISPPPLPTGENHGRLTLSEPTSSSFAADPLAPRRPRLALSTHPRSLGGHRSDDGARSPPSHQSGCRRPCGGAMAGRRGIHLGGADYGSGRFVKISLWNPAQCRREVCLQSRRRRCAGRVLRDMGSHGFQRLEPRACSRRHDQAPGISRKSLPSVALGPQPGSISRPSKPAGLNSFRRLPKPPRPCGSS